LNLIRRSILTSSGSSPHPIAVVEINCGSLYQIQRQSLLNQLIICYTLQVITFKENNTYGHTIWLKINITVFIIFNLKKSIYHLKNTHYLFFFPFYTFFLFLIFKSCVQRLMTIQEFF
jgi:hypothetical protein